MTPIEFRLPDVGEGIAVADIIEWQVAEGDRVQEHQDLVQIQTDKAIVVIPCPFTGVVSRLGASEGETLAVGEVLAVFEPDATVAPAPAPAPVRAAEIVPPGSAAAPDSGPVGPDGAPAAPDGGPVGPDVTSAGAPDAGSDGEAPPPHAPFAAPDAPAFPHAARPLAAPATRRLARELGVELTAVAGSGRNGRILREDIEQAASTPVAPSTAGADPAPAPHLGRAADEIVALRGVRRAIAHTLTRAWQEIPHIIDYREVDATRLLEARAALKQRARDRGEDALATALSPTPLIVRAAARALADHPYVNASIDLEREQITLHRQVNLGIATATAEGLTVPVLHDADHKSLAQIALEVADLARTARERRLRPEQLAGGTFTVNNYGGLGIWLGTPIIRPPEVANLGVGAIRDRVVAVNGRPAVRPILVLAVSGDHRVLDGHTLAAFVTQVVGLLEEPLLLFEDLG